MMLNLSNTQTEMLIALCDRVILANGTTDNDRNEWDGIARMLDLDHSLSEFDAETGDHCGIELMRCFNKNSIY